MEEPMIKKKILLRTITIVAAGLIACLAQTAQASTVQVGRCKTGLTNFTKIQDAVNAVPPGSTIDVCPGTYPEQVIITQKVTIVGVPAGSLDAAVVSVPASGLAANGTDIFGSSVAAQIFVQNATGVTISHITVDGSNNQLTGCGINPIGIYYQNSSGTITDDVARNQIMAPALQGCQVGLAINVESNSGAPIVNILNNSVRNYDKNGITASGPGTGGGPNVTVTGNTVIGIGATAATAQNGIQVGFGASGKVMGNNVADDIYTGPTFGSSGILIIASSGITVSANVVDSTQLAIVPATDPTFGPADNTFINANHIGGTQTFDAIDLCSNNDTAELNIIYGSAQSAIHVDDECPGPGSTPSGNNNVVRTNTINEACAGILLGSGSGNTISANTFFNVVDITLAGNSCPAVAMASANKAGGSGEKHPSLRPSPYKR
jgi:parallel beta-helix repeat protein